MEYVKKEKLTEKDILLEFVKDIGKICQTEFRGGYINKTISGTIVNETYIEDSRKRYCQAVEFLSDFLLPYIKEKNKSTYTEIFNKIDALIKQRNEDKITSEVFITEKLRMCRRLMQHLFILLKKQGWLRKGQKTG